MFASSRQSEDTSEILVADIVRHLLPYFQDVATNKYRLDVHGIGPDAALRCNSSELSIAFQMIIQNAIEAMPTGGTLYIRTTHTTGNGPRTLQIEFQDTGVGMNEELLRRCLQPFVSTKFDREGTGLGLAVVYGIARRYGATVRIESEVRKGTTVILSFPL